MSDMGSRVENRRSDGSLPVGMRLGFHRVPSIRFDLVLFPVPLFFAFFPPRSHNRSPYRRKLVSGQKIYRALPTSSLRNILSPALPIGNALDNSLRHARIPR